MLWKALWALIFGYIISAGIQVLVTRQQMANVLGERGPTQAGLASFFGFVLYPQRAPSLQEMVRFAIDYTFWLNLTFLGIGALLLWVHFRGGSQTLSMQRSDPR